MEAQSNNITIKGRIQSDSSLPITIESSNPVVTLKAISTEGQVVNVKASQNTITTPVESSIGITVIEIEGEAYTGAYRVKPNFETQILETRNKILTDNVNVSPIEVQRVSNLSGGKTVYIGGLIDVEYL